MDGWVDYIYKSSSTCRDIALCLCFRPTEQTYTSGADAEAASGATRIQTSSKAEQPDAAAASASLSLGPLMDSLAPVKVKSRTELTQSSKTCRLITFLSILVLTFAKTWYLVTNI